MSEFHPKPFRCELAVDGQTARVSPVGELDLATMPELESRLHEALAGRATRLVVDLRGLDFIDSTGLTALTRWSIGARTDGYELSIVPGPEKIQRLFELTGLGDHFDFIDG